MKRSLKSREAFGNHKTHDGFLVEMEAVGKLIRQTLELASR